MTEQKCCSCGNYECSWHLKFEPVPGWTAKEVPWNGSTTFAISDCPEFRPSRANLNDRIAPCCEKCNSVTKNLCKVKNGTCRAFQMWQSGEKANYVDIDAEVKRLFAEGHSVANMSEILNCSEEKISGVRKRLGIVGRAKCGVGSFATGKRIDDADVKRLYDEGHTVPEMAKALKCSKKTIFSAKKRLGLKGTKVV